MDDVYKRLATKLDQLPNGFPATESGVELKILQKIFAPEEAEMALRLSPVAETPEDIAKRLDKALPEIESILDIMVRKGQIGSSKMRGQQMYMLYPFLVGIYEFQLNLMDKELADLFEEYLPVLHGSLGNFAPGFFRVVPVNTQIKAEHQVHRYEDVRQMFEKAKTFQLMDCICRKERALQGKPCTHSVATCLSFSNSEGAFDKYPMGKIISRRGALDVIAKAEQEGLVHQTYNVQSGNMFICNCCPCCCVVLRGVKESSAPYLTTKSNFFALIDEETCDGCGICAEERCPMDAIAENNGAYRVKPERCIGCGVCTGTCPTGSITLIRKPEGERDEPPANLLDWYSKRAASRGIEFTNE